MFVYTAKLTKKRLVGIVAAVFVLLLALILAVSSLKDGAAATASAEAAESDAAECAGLTVKLRGIRTNEDRIALLQELGWEVSEEPSDIQEVQIPETFDEVYENYNLLQQTQGLELSKYQGKTVRRYTYTVSNYPGAETDVVANLLIYRNKVIGGDVCSLSLGGFMQNLSYPQ